MAQLIIDLLFLRVAIKRHNKYVTFGLQHCIANQNISIATKNIVLFCAIYVLQITSIYDVRVVVLKIQNWDFVAWNFLL